MATSSVWLHPADDQVTEQMQDAWLACSHLHSLLLHLVHIQDYHLYCMMCGEESLYLPSGTGILSLKSLYPKICVSKMLLGLNLTLLFILEQYSCLLSVFCYGFLKFDSLYIILSHKLVSVPCQGSKYF